MAFQQAVALGDALEREDLSFYAAQHHRLARRPRMMESVMLAMDSTRLPAAPGDSHIGGGAGAFFPACCPFTRERSVFSFALRALSRSAGDFLRFEKVFDRRKRLSHLAGTP